jgi:hypothetical protein
MEASSVAHDVRRAAVDIDGRCFEEIGMNLRMFNGGDEGDTELFEDLPEDPVSESQARSTRAGKEFDQEAFEFLERCGATIEDNYVTVHGYPMDALVSGPNGNRFYVDAHGTPDRTDRPQAGMRRTDTIYKFGFKASRLHARGCEYPVLLITSHLPVSRQAQYLLSELQDVLFDAVATNGDFAGARRLHCYFNDEPAPTVWQPAEWRAVQLPLGFTLLDDEGDDDA